jgi:hypothetical protein
MAPNNVLVHQGDYENLDLFYEYLGRYKIEKPTTDNGRWWESEEQLNWNDRNTGIKFMLKDSNGKIEFESLFCSTRDEFVNSFNPYQKNLVNDCLYWVDTDDTYDIKDPDKEFKPKRELKPDPESDKPKEGLRFDQGKPRADLLSPIAMMGLSTVLAHGCDKYGARNWQKGMKWGKVIGSLLRHTFKFMAGEDFDEETGFPHVDHIATNAMFLQEYFRKHKDLDDREKTGLE